MSRNLSTSKSPSPLPPCVFSCRIVQIDYYLGAPLKDLDVCFSHFRSSPVDKVPILRAFGATPGGQKTCVHIHGSFPYLLVPCLMVDPTDSYLQQLARSIDHALQVSLGASSRSVNHVFKIVVVKGIPFYGYHDREELFLKIYLINPGFIKRLADLLLAGAVMNQVLQPHESHIPFSLQFMIDHNLFGMNHIHVSAVKFRVSSSLEGSSPKVRLSPSQRRRRRSLTSPLLSPLSTLLSPSLLFHPSQSVWDVNTLPSDLILCEPRRSVTELEVDIMSADILNRHELSLVSDGYPGLAAIWKEERQRREALSIDDPLSPPPSPERGTQPYHFEEQRLREIFDKILQERLGTSSDLANPENNQGTQPTPSNDITFSQSCDLDLHQQPIELEGDSDNGKLVAKDDGEVLVDEEAVKHSMELSQRLSEDAIEKATDVELLELMTELYQTPLSQPADSQVQSQSHSHSQSQLYSSSQTQSVGEQLKMKLQRSHSCLSARSLFSSGSQDDNDEEDSEQEGEEEGGDLASREKSHDKDDSEAGMEDGEHMEVDSGDDIFIAMETELDNRKFSSPVVKISSNPEQQVTPPQLATARSKVNLDSQQRKCGKRTPVSPFGSFKLPSRLRYKVQDETDEDSEVELPISTPLASPIPPSPKSKELQNDILKELDSFGSDEVGGELDQLGLTDSQFGVPYSQLLQTPSSQCNTYSRSHPELDKVWNSTAAVTAGESFSEVQSPLKLQGTEAAGRRLRQNVQLEYDMPEISASQLETSSDPIFNPLETDSPRSSLVKGQSSSKKGQSPLVMHQQTSLMKSHRGTPTKGHQASMTLSLRKGKRQLLRKPAEDGTKGASSDSCVSSRTRSKKKCRDIPQLDGNSDKPSSSSSSGHKGLSRKRRRTLRVQYKRTKESKSRTQPVKVAQVLEDVASSSSEMEKQSSVSEAMEEKVTASSAQEGEKDPPSSAAAAPLDEGMETAGQLLLEEEGLLCEEDVQSGLVETEVLENFSEEGAPENVEDTHRDGSIEASGDASQHLVTREKARLSLSLKKLVNKTRRTRESKPDMIVTETVLNSSWRAETEGLLTDIGAAVPLSSPIRTRKNYTHPGVVCSPSRKVSRHLKEQVLRCRLILKVDKLSTHLFRSTKENRAAGPKDEGELIMIKPSSKRRKKSSTPLSSGSEADLSNRGNNEREDRYKRRCRKRSTRNQWSPKFLARMSYEQQLKRAIEISKQTYFAESAQGQRVDSAESAQGKKNAELAKLLQEDDKSAQLQPDIVQEQGDDRRWGKGFREPREQLGSPLMFSPPSSDDMDRTVIEESPLREGEGALEDGILNQNDILDKRYLDEKRELEEAGAAAAGDGDNEWMLDMSISSISESPPYTSSPAGGREGEEEGMLLHDSNLKLQLETSFTELTSPLVRSSSPVQVTHKKTPPPFDADTSFLGGEGFPCVILASETAPKAAAVGSDTKPSALPTHSQPTSTVTPVDSKDIAECISVPTTPPRAITELEAAAYDDNQDQLMVSDYPVTSVLASPEGSESYSEADQLLSSQMEVSIDSEEDFHLSIGSSSSEEEIGGIGGRESTPDTLSFNTEKTSLAVKFGPYLSPQELQYQGKEDEGCTSHVEVCGRGSQTAVSRVLVLSSNGRSELAPPTPKELAESAPSYNLPSMYHQEPFYSCPTDVQHPLMIGGRILRVSSKMPYDLKEFHVLYSRDGESENVQFSSTGLQHMRTVLGMVNMGTEPLLPPVCHPTSDRLNKTNPYTFEDYKRDMEQRATFFKPDKVVITPTLPPPHPSKLAALLLKARTDADPGAGGVGKDEQGKVGNQQNCDEKGEDKGGHGSCTTTPSKSASGSPSPSLSSSMTAAAVKALTAPKFEGDSSYLQDDSRKSPSLCRSDISLDGSGHDSSLTSYQVPHFHGHSTPMVRGGASGEGEESIEEGEGPAGEEKLSLTPVRTKKKETTPKPRPLLLPFTPIHPQLLKRDHSQLLEGPTPTNAFGFKVSQSALPGSCDIHDVQFLTCLSIELHVRTRASLRPDPEFDPVLAVFYFIHNDWPLPSGGGGGCHGDGDGSHGNNTQLGIIAIDVDNAGFRQSHVAKPSEMSKGGRSPGKGSASRPMKRSPSPLKSPSLPPSSSVADSISSSPQPRIKQFLDGCGLAMDIEVTYVSSELELIEKLIQLVRQVDPDFLIGYEVTMASWGYLIERAAALNVNLTNELSRMPGASQSDCSNRGNDSIWKTMTNVIGRTMFGVWRLLKHEVALNVYSFENVAYHILHHRVPNYSFKTLTSWYDHPTSLYRHRVVEHYLMRCQGNHQLLESFNLIGRISEFSRLYGIEFESVVNRGSQYRVESMMLRLAKPANFVPVSPSVQQRARMAAPECLPLILEPESKFYADPVLVLDFQSLYPSMVIAYNYCFSTCLGRVHHLASHGHFPFGTTSLNVPNSVLEKLKDDVQISPNGVMFVKHHVRRGILTRMLEEILGTRIMVKSSMKKYKQNKALERMLNARQLGLKLIANTTYGYTGASFSGRMPCIEVADSIVRKGRETLERAIQMVNSSPEWKARVVYGDTDSLFVLLKGASKEEAFRIGKEICEWVTADNPKPVKLKFEKVYLPCILQTKKRYVGFAYESLDQKEPEFDAKGIETVRRDGCPAVAKILEKSLRLLYSTKDVSQVKSYIQRQFGKVLEGRVDLKDYTFAKEYRGRQYYRPGAAVPALELTKQSLLIDRRSEPRIGERVPYVVVYGTPGQPLIQLVRKPHDLLDNPGLRLNGIYYITKQLLPALERCFSLLGVDIRQWYSDMPQVHRAPAQAVEGGKKLRGTIGQYFATMHCPVCEQLTVEGVCAQCRRDPAKVATTLTVRMRDAEAKCCDIESICQSCTGSLDIGHTSACVSLDCPINYRRYKASQEKASAMSLRKLLTDSTTD